jgi:hypothetical protein
MLITWSKYKRMIIDYNEYELNYIINVFKILHNNKAKPVVIEKSIHRKFHEIYGSKDNSPEQFSEFVLEREWEK